VFERFTERARQVVVLAQDEAIALKHNYIGTEHILLGLLRVEEGLAARVLASLHVTVDEVRAQVMRIIGQGDEPPAGGQIPFTPRAKKVLELALREAMALKHNYIGTEHILLGIARENQGVAARVLLDFDADAEKIRNEVKRMLGGRAVHPQENPELRAELEKVRAEKEAAIDAKDFEKAASLRDLERGLTADPAGHPRALPRPPRSYEYFRDPMRQFPLLPGWSLFALSLGIGILIGWAIWGL
jgi:ATP-dependent Clp protease ATP-binding subunit ClpA